MIEDIETIKAIASDSKARIDRILINYEQLEEENKELKAENEKLKQEIESWKKRAAEVYWDS